MAKNRLKIWLGNTCILDAQSISEEGALSFRAARAKAGQAGACPLLSLLPSEIRRMIKALPKSRRLNLRLDFVETAKVAICYMGDGVLAVTDHENWWRPLEETTLEDLLTDTGLRDFANLTPVSDPFAA